MSLRLGLCCTFRDEPIRFRRTTALYAGKLAKKERWRLFRQLVAANVAALGQAVDWAVENGVGAFRVTSDLLPLRTHPKLGYRLDELDEGGALTAGLRAVGERARQADLRLSLHPDQFVVLGSARAEVVESSVAELEAQAEWAALIGAEQLTLHGGGAQGGKVEALRRLALGAGALSPEARSRLVLENDDRVYTVADLLPVCQELALPLVYDVHHHRCNPDGLGEEEATRAAAATWGGREPWVHLSSPKGGWGAGDPRHHADYIDPGDLPECWQGRAMTIDIEAKAKEQAVTEFGMAAGLGLRVSPPRDGAPARRP